MSGRIARTCMQQLDPSTWFLLKCIVKNGLTLNHLTSSTFFCRSQSQLTKSQKTLEIHHQSPRHHQTNLQSTTPSDQALNRLPLTRTLRRTSIPPHEPSIQVPRRQGLRPCKPPF
ncbi:hypothetical protein M3J07_004173 [Ascochyta lentis]